MLPVIPVAYDNVKQGMIYIENLTEIVRLIVENKANGVFPVQDEKAVSSVEIMNEISNALKLKKHKSKLLGIPFRILKIKSVNKLYGGVAYSQKYAYSELGNYNIYSFKEGIRRTYL